MYYNFVLRKIFRRFCVIIENYFVSGAEMVAVRMLGRLLEIVQKWGRQEKVVGVCQEKFADVEGFEEPQSKCKFLFIYFVIIV